MTPDEDDRWVPPTGDNPFGQGTPRNEDLPGQSAAGPEQPQWAAPAPPTANVPGGSKDGNGKAVVSMVLGIAGLPVCCPILIPSILAIVFGHMAKGDMDRSGNTSSNRGMATAGIIMGWIGAVLFALGAGLLILLTILGSGLDWDDPDGDGLPNFLDEHDFNKNLQFIGPVLRGLSGLL
ncbi:MAG TPA: DUF4190 domain-containing protein [Baekduia sp.]|nr:DUF4190 domain-containing protein [Baekduia sp.]